MLKQDLAAARADLASEQGADDAGDRRLRGAGAAARSDGGPARHQAVVAAASSAGLMKPVNLAAQLAAAETELTCLRLMLAQVTEAREELRQERDDWRREAAKLIAAKLKEADQRRFAPLARRPWAYRGPLRRPALHAHSDPCIVCANADRWASRQATSIAPAPAGCLHSSGSPALRRPSNSGGRFGAWSVSHLTVRLGLRRRASASAVFALSVLPARA